MTTEKEASAPIRKARVDAVRNRKRILAVAKEAFSRDGGEASLDDVAKQAGVGSGTLYRHFPTRAALIEAVYKDEVQKLAGAADRLIETLPPLQALRSWMLLFVDHVAEKKLIIPAMEMVDGGSLRLIAGARDDIQAAFYRVARRAVDSGDLRPDTDPNDLIRALVGVFHTTGTPGWEESARRLVDILIAGSRRT